MTPVLGLSSGTIAAIVVVVVLDLFAIVFGLSFMRARKAQRAAETADLPGVLAPQPPAKAPKPISRREFFRKSLIFLAPGLRSRVRRRVASRSCGRS